MYTVVLLLATSTSVSAVKKSAKWQNVHMQEQVAVMNYDSLQKKKKEVQKLIPGTQLGTIDVMKIIWYSMGPFN